MVNVRETRRINIRETSEDVFGPPVNPHETAQFVKDKIDVFTMNAPAMVEKLLKDADGNAALALHRLMRHMHNVAAGTALNTASLKLAKIRLEEMTKQVKRKL